MSFGKASFSGKNTSGIPSLSIFSRRSEKVWISTITPKKKKNFLKKELKKYAQKIQEWGELPQESIQMFTENMAESIGLDASQTQSIMTSVKKSKPKKKKQAVFKMKMRSGGARSSNIKKEGETVGLDKSIKEKDLKSPRKSDKPPRTEKLERPERVKSSERLPVRSYSSNPGGGGAAPPRPKVAPPFMCEKCRQSFRFKYELNAHKCEN